MQKQEVYNIADTNIANLGSDLERDIKKASAEGEPAWEGAGSEVGLLIWRIEQFHVIAWPTEQYGSFYSGDSYIILNTYQNEGSEAYLYDVHFWLGTETTQDEAGTAAYKTVELDTLLDDKPIQHREVEGYESPLFSSYFPDGIVTMEGGAESGFNHVTPEEYNPRLLRIKGKFQNIQTKQVPLVFESLNSGDVFLLDLGMKVFQFNGTSAGLFEKRKAGDLVNAIKTARVGCESWIVDENDNSDPELDADFWEYFGGYRAVAPADSVESDTEVSKENVLYRLSDESGTLEFNLVSTGNLSRDMLDSDDVFIIDVGHTVFCWVGTGASEDERKNGMQYATQYVNEHHPGLPLSVTLCHEAGLDNNHYRRMFE